MKKAIYASIVIALLLLVSPVSGYGHVGGHGFSGGHGFVGHGFGGHGFVGHGFRGHGFAGHGFAGALWIGPGWWGPWWWGSPAYWGVTYPYYAVAPTVVEESPPVYANPAPQPEEQNYWYYCQNSSSYYPYVRECPDGWSKVAPSPPAPNQ